jgi:hypothetical protein
MQQFVDGWQVNIVPSREKFGFKVIAAWTDSESEEFIWILRWDGPEGYAAADLAYYESPIRKAVAWDPRPFILEDQLRIMREQPISG